MFTHPTLLTLIADARQIEALGRNPHTGALSERLRRVLRLEAPRFVLATPHFLTQCVVITH